MSTLAKTLDAIVQYMRDTLKEMPAPSDIPDCDIERSYIGEQDIEKLAKRPKPLVLIVPRTKIIETKTRDHVSTKFEVSIGVQKCIKSTNDRTKLNDEIDELMRLMECFFEMFFFKTVLEEDHLEITCDRPNHGSDAPLYDEEELLFRNHFFSVMKINVEVIETRNA